MNEQKEKIITIQKNYLYYLTFAVLISAILAFAITNVSLVELGNESKESAQSVGDGLSIWIHVIAASCMFVILSVGTSILSLFTHHGEQNFLQVKKGYKRYFMIFTITSFVLLLVSSRFLYFLLECKIHQMVIYVSLFVMVVAVLFCLDKLEIDKSKYLVVMFTILLVSNTNYLLIKELIM